ncbi:MAG: dihydroxyacetone kinase subunit L [Lentisphaerae bacterium]|jgi:phosphoenolpyruvate---glycerone phosphotransferase subunit DhaL|nr:dihydroxyacetone kinase subunit L [Lentisphaerota bacterium]MBT4817875.1 dihydroxyacetone kinase subunit L [Lentisphaerota bacterium]MBT5612551.1 dihydroxyacetone kinase subunit L [Lentisphaerota bacterium]MBT7061346.1 dihydroxyacetone kinase subunit L [Lentisphaerota bacterium]MBT7840487.1 dihydroxyacetone kinase subunit L [Lentisphaerota bacterium]
MSAFSKAIFAEMLKQAEANIAAEHENLSKLDAATGDGDHGIAMSRTMKAIGVAVEEAADKSMGDMLKSVAMKVMTCDGGSTSPLLGSYFLGLASAATADELTPEETAAVFQAGLDRFQKTSKAQLGDKTMLDALRPATEALGEALTGNKSLGEAFSAAAEAATEGAEKTKAYVAKFGRARTMGERAIGHYDPGAVSISHIFRGFAAAVS